MGNDNGLYELKKEGSDFYLDIKDRDQDPHIVVEALKADGIFLSLERVKDIIEGESDGLEKISPYEDFDPVKVKISEDRMKAWIRLCPATLKAGVDMDMISRALDSAGVKEGIKRDLLAGMAEQGNFVSDEWIEAASGTPSRESVDAKIEVVAEGKQKKQDNENTAQVDLKDLELITNVKEGQLLVRKIPPIEGADGMDVTGREIKVASPKDVPLRGGHNTRLSDDSLELYSTAAGYFVSEGNKFSVEKKYEVKGDVDYSTGNLECYGSINIYGSVKNDFNVHAHEVLEIAGVVEGAHLFSGEDMILKSSVRGMGKGTIDCGGNLYAEYMDQCTVTVAGDLHFKRGLMHCEVETEGRISLTEGGKGVIAGGSVKSGTEVHCNILGTRMGTKTIINVGVSPKLIDRKNTMIEKNRELEKKKNTIEKNLSYLSRIANYSGLTMKQKDLVQEHMKLRSVIDEKIVTIEELLEKIEIIMDNAKKKGTVKVYGVCHPGVKVTIGKETMVMQDTMEEISFIASSDGIKIIPLSS